MDLEQSDPLTAISYLQCHEDMIGAVQQLESLGTVPTDLLERLRISLSQFGSLIEKTSAFSEQLLVHLTKGKPTSYDNPYDVVSENGQRIEVKFSKLNSPNKSRPALRWNWTNLSGGTLGKDYDYLFLLGEKDPRFEGSFILIRDRYVGFCIPSENVKLLRESGFISESARGSLALPTDPSFKKTKALMKYQIDADGIERKFTKEKIS